MHPTQKTIDSLRKIAERVNKLTSRKQFEDNSFNPPRETKVAKDTQKPTGHITLPGRDRTSQVTQNKIGDKKPKGSRIRKQPKSRVEEAKERGEKIRSRFRRVDKSGSHDQSSHSPTGRGAKPEADNPNYPPKRRRGPYSKVTKGGQHDQSTHGQRGGVAPLEGPESYESRKPSGTRPFRTKPTWELRAMKRALTSMPMMNSAEENTRTADVEEELKSRRKRKVSKRSIVKHPGHPDQGVHSPTGRPAKQKRPSSPAPTKVRVRSAIQSTARRAGEKVRQTRQFIGQNRERINAAIKDIDTLLDAVDVGTRLYRELKDVKDALQARRERKEEKVTKGKMSDKELAESKRLAERLKGKEGVDNPHALARWQVQHKKFVQGTLEKGIGHSLDILANAMRLIGNQAENQHISESDDKKLQEIIDDIQGMVGYLKEVKEQGFFEKGGQHDQRTHSPTGRKQIKEEERYRRSGIRCPGLTHTERLAANIAYQIRTGRKPPTVLGDLSTSVRRQVKRALRTYKERSKKVSKRVVRKHPGHPDQSVHGRARRGGLTMRGVNAINRQEIERYARRHGITPEAVRRKLRNVAEATTSPRRAARAGTAVGSATRRALGRAQRATGRAARRFTPTGAARAGAKLGQRLRDRKRRKMTKGEPAVPNSGHVDRPSFTTPAVAREQKRQGIKPNAKGRGESTARVPGY